MGQKKFFIIDAMAMVFRNYYAFSQRPLTTSKGFPTSALYGSAAFMGRLVEKEQPDYLIVASDSKAPTFRHKIYSEYKANRTEMPEDLEKQIPYFFEMLDHMGCKVLKEDGVEADDIIASLVSHFASDDLHCYIVSGDKDFMQLVNKNVSLYSPKKGGAVETFGPKEVVSKFDCEPNQFIDFLALTGDAADNVPGVPGIGLKGAAKLLSEFKTLDHIYSNLDQVKNKRQNHALEKNKDLAMLSRKLVELKMDLKTIDSLEEVKFSKEDFASSDSLKSFYRKYELKTLAEKVNSKNKKLKSDKENNRIEEISVVSFEQATKENHLIRSKEDFTIFQNKIKQENIFSFDTETTGLDFTQDKPIGVSFSFLDQKSFYIPLIPSQLDDGLKQEKIIEFLQEVLGDDSKVKIAHNLKFDKQMLENIKVDVTAPFDDTMLMSFVLNPTNSQSLDNLSQLHLGIEKIRIKDILATTESKKTEDVELSVLCEYACEDSLCCLNLYGKFFVELQKKGLYQLYRDVELPFLSVLDSMEQKGILLNTDHLQKLSVLLTNKISELEKNIYMLAGEEFNISSPKQLQLILYEKLKVHEKLNIKNLKKTKTGYSTDVSMLQLLSEDPIIQNILEYRTHTKLKSTYVDALPKQVSPVTKRIHTSFHQTGTETGRLSSSNPNLQNIPIRSLLGQKVREAFVAKDGYKLISADYSQVELRIMAHFAREEVLRDAFRKKKDIHRTTAAIVFGIDDEEVNGEQRSQAKAINFGILYGMGARKLAQTTGFSIAESKSFIEEYFSGFPKVKEMLLELEQKANDLGFAQTLTGRRRYLPGLKSTHPREQALARNMAINTPIQGSAADLIKIAMINLYKKLKASGLNCDILLQIHDELLLECHVDDIEAAKQMIKEQMEGAWKLFVPVEVSMGCGKDWLEAHA